MKLAIVILVASVMALGGIASADVPAPEIKTVEVTGTIVSYLTFAIMENTAGIKLSPTVTPSDEIRTDSTTGTDYIDTNGNWVITLVAPARMTTSSTPIHQLSNNLVVGYNNVRYEGPNGMVDSGAPTGGKKYFDTFYGQKYEKTDYGGVYSATATWTATSTF